MALQTSFPSREGGEHARPQMYFTGAAPPIECAPPPPAPPQSLAPPNELAGDDIVRLDLVWLDDIVNEQVGPQSPVSDGSGAAQRYQ